MTPAATTVAARPVTASGAAPARGRNRITSKALHRVVAAVTAEALGVKASRVGVDLADEEGLLVLTVSTPIRVVSLARVREGADVVGRSGGSVIDRAARAQETIRGRVNEITGSAIGRVTVRLSGADIKREERVR
ncbi:hypothetical protein N1028_12520 [Herbiconiux sp. CPCC 203407]|uniref:Uncharacterized protein n=1 Tax=Herbiconiux oxytropis TaxID=2970915 RepID=A0AA41XHN3_9MICO|nr:hypothetical protein [Herbiconiux oxytropis]MCS5721655.1 hypothetical protein [Herbiconiux oxytropis]MCS5726718.1 hypothetical protein [Herbiconiux oxytropis]